MKIRPLCASDVTNLLNLWVDSWREAMPNIDFMARRAWLAAFLHDPAHAAWVAEVASAPVGFVTVEAAYLHQLVVAPVAKGDGTAGRLLETAKIAAGAILALDVNQANRRAGRFYGREGFLTQAEGANPVSGLPTWHMVWRRPPCPGCGGP